jgi:NADPH:quinone reductase-like Zn-dependent oxidoreductase
MKAVVYERHGPPEVLQVKEVPKPVPKSNEVLIRIYATTVAFEDVMMRRVTDFNRNRAPKKAILGTYLAGEVETVGEDVEEFKNGDQVYGFTGFFGRLGLGAYAEYTCMREAGCLAIKPSNMTYEEAAAIPNGGLTALPFLRDKGKIKNGQEILIYGASGAVGTAAIQLARKFGAKVTGLCSTTNLKLVSSLGATKVIDYTKDDFTKTGQMFDIIFDAVGKISFSKCKNSLKPKGIFLTTVPMPKTMLQTLRNIIIGGKKVRFKATGLMRASKKKRDLIFLTKLIEAGKMKAVIDKRYPLAQIVEAHRYVDAGHKKGNVVITINHN